MLTEMIEDHLHRTLTLLDRVVLRHNLHPSQRRKRHQSRNGSDAVFADTFAAGWVGALVAPELVGAAVVAATVSLVGSVAVVDFPQAVASTTHSAAIRQSLDLLVI